MAMEVPGRQIALWKAPAVFVAAPPAMTPVVLAATSTPSANFQHGRHSGIALGLSLGLGLSLNFGPRRYQRRRQQQVSALRSVVALTAVGRDKVGAFKNENVEEAMMRLGVEITEALEKDDLVTAANAQQKLKEVQMDKPSGACGHLIREDCRAAIALLKLGESVEVDSRIKAVRKLGRWLRWGKRGSARGLVPAVDALGGLLCALRSEPEVAWTAQCALFHAARCRDGIAQTVRDGSEGTLAKLLVKETTPFPLVLPRLASRSAEVYERAFRTSLVCDFFSELKSLSLSDPGYGHDDHWQEMNPLLNFCRLLGRSVSSLEELRLFGFEDCAMTLIVPQLVVPKLTCLHVVGACQTAQGSRALLGLLRRVGRSLTELELNVWTEFLYEADDPLVELGPMPNVKKLTVRAPPCVPWEHFARIFPAVEELTFLYHHDFAINSMEVIDNCSDDILEQREQLEEHTSWLYRDAVIFARDMHVRGFRRLGKGCKNLKEIRVAVADTSYGYDVTPAEERLQIRWRRVENTSTFRRDAEMNSETRDKLEAQSTHQPLGLSDEEYEMSEQAMEEEASAAGAAVMLQVIRQFDDPSIEASFGLNIR